MKALILIVLLGLWAGAASEARADGLREQVMALDAKSYDAKREAIEALAGIDHERVLPILQAMLDGQLYRYDEADTLAFGIEEGEMIRLADALTGADLGLVEEWDVDKIRINNSVRGRLRTALAGLQLRAANSAVRLRSARDLARSPDPALRDTVYAALRQENSSAVKEALELALAMMDIESHDGERRFRAVQTLGSSVAPESIAALSRLSLRDDSGRVTGLVGIRRDITDSKKAAEALRASEALAQQAAARADAEKGLLDAVLEAAPVGVIVADAQGKLLRTNAANELLWGTIPYSQSIDEYREWKGWWADQSARRGQPLDAHDWAMARALRGEVVRKDLVEVEPFDKPNSRRTSSSVSMSFSKAASATEEMRVWVPAPPSSSCVTTSLVTVLTTSGPVTNM